PKAPPTDGILDNPFQFLLRVRAARKQVEQNRGSRVVAEDSQDQHVSLCLLGSLGVRSNTFYVLAFKRRWRTHVSQPRVTTVTVSPAQGIRCSSLSRALSSSPSSAQSHRVVRIDLHITWQAHSPASCLAFGCVAVPQATARVSAPLGQYSSARKRSYKRAIRRAAASSAGGTRYRGRWQTLHQLHSQHHSQEQTTTTTAPRAKACTAPKGLHVRFLSLNCGGLSSEVYQELLLSLAALAPDRRPHVVAVQETHWAETSNSDYVTGPWRVLSSHRHGYKAAGVLLLVHKAFSADCVISTAEPYPGRLLHVRLTHMAWALDILAPDSQSSPPQTAAQVALLPSGIAVSPPMPRSAQAHPLARQTGRNPMTIAAWRAGGRHVPLSGVLPLIRFASLNKPPTVPRSWNKEDLMQLLSEPQCPQALQLRQSVHQDITSCRSIQAINDCLTSALQLHLPSRAGSARLASWQSPAMQGGIRAMWTHYRQWRQAASRQTSTIWKAWFHFAKFQKAHRDFRRAGRLAKHAWYSDKLQELGMHARRHNIRALYQGVRQLATGTQATVYSGTATISPEKQAQLLSAHLRSSYTGQFCQPDRAAVSQWTPLRCPVHWQVMPKLSEPVNNLTTVDELWHAAVIDSCMSTDWTTREARAGIPKPQAAAGGLQLSLDLSSAFDHMEWLHIATALDDASVPTELQTQVLEWYRDMKYVLTVQGQTVDISASRGLKQGCLIAPLIWSLVTGRFLYELALCADPMWVTTDVTTYADDFHAGSQISSYVELCRLEVRLGQLLDILCAAGLTVNAQKSAVLFLFRGNFASKWLKQHLKTTPDGPVLRLRTPTGGLHQLRTLYLRQLRAILRSPAHLNHVSNEDILRKAGVPDVAEIVERDLARLQTSLQHLQVADSSLLAPHVLRFAEGLQLSLTSQPPARDHAPGTRECEPEAILECRYCGETFSTYHLRRAHEARKHQEALEMTAQERLFFGGVCPSLQSKREREEGPSEKRPRTADALASFQSPAAAQMPQAPKGKGKGKNKGKAAAKGQWGGWNRQSATWSQDHWPAGQGAWNTPWTSEYGLPDMVQKLTSLAIKHEYAINSMMQDHTLYLFVKPGDEGLLPILFATSEKWNATQQTDPSQITEPLRLVMMKAFRIELGQRLKATKDQPESTQKAKELGWLTDQGQWKTLVWDPTAQDLREKQGGKLHMTDELIGQSVELRRIITDETLFRFQSLRGLSRAPQTAWIQLAIEVSVRDMGNRVWEILHSWIGCAALHIMGCRLRRERGGLSQQARTLRGW
ncbi:clpC, partial [Symbiodinium sp. CCMP2592]